MRVSEWLVKYRKAIKMSQKTLAEKVSKLGYTIKDTQISNYEREYDKDQFGNPTVPKRIFMELAAQVLERPVDEAFEVAGYKADEIQPIPYKRTLDALARSGTLSDKDDEFIAGLIDQMEKRNLEEK